MPNSYLFRCPICRTTLSALDDPARCAACGQMVEFRDGIPSFAANHDYFFGEIGADEMRDLARSVEELGWGVAFDQMCSRQTPAMADYIRQYIADASRANWKYLLRLPERGRVLDFGCGWGETTISLSRSVTEVVSMDLTLERLLLLQARVADLGIDGVNFVHGGDRLPLPFADQCFDAVVLNGVLEWVPVTGNRDPRECQLALLRELRRILRPAGQVYIGIENRIGLKYFVGRLDEHSQLRFTSLMPRAIADRYCRWRIGQDYRTYTYSQSGYRNLLRDAGFNHIDFFCPYPDYREFDRIVPVDKASVSRLYRPTASWKRVVKRLPGLSTLLRSTVPSFSIIAGKEGFGESLLVRALAEIGRQINQPLSQPSGYLSQRTGEVLATCAMGNEAGNAFVRIAESEPAIKSRLRSSQVLTALAEQYDETKSIWKKIPRSLGHGKIGEIGFSVEQAIDGQSWQQLAMLRKRPDRALVEIAQWLLELQCSTNQGVFWKPDKLRIQLTSTVQQIGQVFPRLHLGQWVHNNHWLGPSSRLPVVVSHGDLHLNNALFEPETNGLAGVIDWDLATLAGIPLTDLAYLFLSYRVETHKQNYHHAFRALRTTDTRTRCEFETIRQFLKAFGLDEMDWIRAVELAVLINVTTLANRRPNGFARIRSDMAAAVREIVDGSCSNGLTTQECDGMATRCRADARRSSA